MFDGIVDSATARRQRTAQKQKNSHPFVITDSSLYCSYMFALAILHKKINHNIEDGTNDEAEGPEKMIVCRLPMHHRIELVSYWRKCVSVRALTLCFHCLTYLTTRNSVAAVVLPILLNFTFMHCFVHSFLLLLKYTSFSISVFGSATVYDSSVRRRWCSRCY